jgi:hypothetical protein
VKGLGCLTAVVSDDYGGGDRSSGSPLDWSADQVEPADLASRVKFRRDASSDDGVALSGPKVVEPDRWAVSIRRAKSVKAMWLVQLPMHSASKLPVGFPMPVRTSLQAHSCQLLYLSRF